MNDKNMVRAYRNSKNELYFHGMKLSEREIESGFISYDTLKNSLGGAVMNNELINIDGYGEWNTVNGTWYDYEEEREVDIFQYYIIDKYAADFLIKHSDEIVFYNDRIDLYLWGITHCGTDWKYVDTDISFHENY